MASSEVIICNAALSKLGAGSILALNQNNENARTMNLRYATVRDAELHRRRWKFSIARTSLPALAAAPAFGYAYQYQLPNDYLRLIEGGDIANFADLSDYRSSTDAALYSIEGKKILTDLGPPLNIRYIAKITDTAQFNASFDEALASRLAWECCERITQSTSKKADCRADYFTAIKEAGRANALEAPPVDTADDTWIMARAG